VRPSVRHQSRVEYVVPKAIEYRALGRVELVDRSGPAARAVPLQPKQLAILAYLAGRAPDDPPRPRDSVLRVFWPETDQGHARAALRQSIYELRREIGDGVIPAKHGNVLSLDPRQFDYDVWNFHRAIGSGDFSQAAALRRGVFLDGLFISHAPEFEHWLDGERDELDRRYREALASLTRQFVERREVKRALEHAHLWAREEPHSGRAVRTLMEVLELAGDRAGALRVADSYVAQLKEDLGAQAEAEVLALAKRIRDEPLSVGGMPSQVPDQRVEFEPDTVIARDQGVVAIRETEPRRIRLRPIRRFGVGVAVLPAIATLVLAGALLWPHGSPPNRDRILVVALAEESGVAEAKAIGRMAQDWIIQVLTDAGFEVVDEFTALAVSKNLAVDGMLRGPENTLAMADEAHAGTVVTGSYYVAGDSVHVQARITDAREGRLAATVGPVAGSLRAPSELVRRLGSEVVATLAPLLDEDLRSFELEAQPATYEAFKAYLEGLEAYLRGPATEAAAAFERAVAADPTFARARLWAAQQHVLLTSRNPGWFHHAKAESLLAPLLDSPERLSRYERCRLDFVMALFRDVASGYEATRCMAQAAPGSDDAKRELALFTYHLHRPGEAIRLLKQSDPDRGLMKQWPQYGYYLGAAYHMVGDYEGELKAASEGRKQHPEYAELPIIEARALASLGRLNGVEDVRKVLRSLPSPEALGSALGRTAVYLRKHQHREAARAVFDAAIAWYQSRPQDSEESRAELAWVLYEGERWDDARRVYGELAGEHPEDPAYMAALGRLAARRGDREDALRISEALRSLRDPPFPTLEHTIERAKIAALLGDLEEAVTLIQVVDRAMPGLEWLHHDIDFESLRDYPSFQELVRVQG